MHGEGCPMAGFGGCFDAGVRWPRGVGGGPAISGYNRRPFWGTPVHPCRVKSVHFEDQLILAGPPAAQETP
jgi:hypothetical protein